MSLILLIEKNVFFIKILCKISFLSINIYKKYQNLVFFKLFKDKNNVNTLYMLYEFLKECVHEGVNLKTIICFNAAQMGKYFKNSWKYLISITLYFTVNCIPIIKPPCIFYLLSIWIFKLNIVARNIIKYVGAKKCISNYFFLFKIMAEIDLHWLYWKNTRTLILLYKLKIKIK